ncbi:MAG: chloride channel protein, partial [Myxococcaceae bacterium]
MPRAAILTLVRGLPGTAKRFWVLVALTGISAGLTAAGLLKGLDLLQRLLWPAAAANFLGAVEGASPLRRVLVPALGGLLVAAVSLLARRPMRGHGTSAIIESIWNKSGRMPLGWTLLRGVVSIAAVGFGAPLGREGALLQAGSATSSAMASRLRIPPDQARLLVACGASAGLAAAYNVPIGA